MSKIKVTNYFMASAIENSVKETRDGTITIIENQPQKETTDPIIEVHKPFHPDRFLFSYNKIWRKARMSNTMVPMIPVIAL